MLTRRQFIGTALGGISAAATVACDLKAAGRVAWPGPIGLELYTVREHFKQDPAATLKRVAEIGYKEVEISPGIQPAKLKEYLSAAGLKAPSGYFSLPKQAAPWGKFADLARSYGLQYMVAGDNSPHLSTEGWKRRADLFNQLGKMTQRAGMKFCYHNHYGEFAKVGNTNGFNILLTHTDPNLVSMEMDVFWVIYAGADPLLYWRKYPGRFPLLHVKGLAKKVKFNPQEDPFPGTHPYVPVGTGRIDWRPIFAHVHEAGAKHIFVELDESPIPEFQAIKISYDYLRNLRLS